MAKAEKQDDLSLLFTFRLAKKMWNASRFCVSSLRRGHANLLCIVPILVYVLPKQERFRIEKCRIYTSSIRKKQLGIIKSSSLLATSSGGVL